MHQPFQVLSVHWSTDYRAVMLVGLDCEEGLNVEAMYWESIQVTN